MADNNTKIILSAEDKTRAAFDSASAGMARISDQITQLRNLTIAGVGLDQIASGFKSMIDAADGMNDLSQKIGVNISQLASWQLAANQSGTSIEAVAKGMKGLSGYMVDHADKLKQAGITATDTAGAMTQLADLFKQMPDGYEKTALAVQLFGKAGMDMIPMLNLGSKGLAEAQEKAAAYASKLAELAPKADEFNDMLSELALNSKAAGMNITTYLMPGLIGMAAWLNDIAKGGADARRALEWLAEKSPLMGGLLAAHDFIDRATALAGAGANPAGRSASGKIGGAAQGVDWAAWDAAAADYEAGRAARARARGLLDKDTQKTGSSANPEAAAIEALRLQLIGATEKFSEFDKVVEKITNGSWKKFSEQTKLSALALAGEIDDVKEAAAEFDKLAKKINDSSKAYEKAFDVIQSSDQALQDLADSLGLEREMLGMNETQRAIAQATRKIDIQLAKDLKKAEDELNLAGAGDIEKEIARSHLEANAARARAMAADGAALEVQYKEWTKFSDQIEQALTDSLMRGFESGKGFGQSFVDSLKNTLKTAALKIVVQALVDPVMGSVRGIMGGGGSNLAGTANNLSTAYNAFSTGNFASTGYGAFATSSMGANLGLSTAYVDTLGGTVGLAEGGTALSGLGTAMPYIGLALAAISIIKSLDNSGTYHQGGMGEFSASGGGLTGGQTSIWNTRSGWADSATSGEISDAQIGSASLQLAQGTVGMLDSLSTSFGGPGGYRVATGFADDSSSDGAWGALRITNNRGTVTDWGDNRGQWAPREFADGQAGRDQYTAAYTASIRDTVLAMDLPGWAKRMITDLGNTPTMEQLGGAITHINQMQTVVGKMTPALTDMVNAMGDTNITLDTLVGKIIDLGDAGTAMLGLYAATDQLSNVFEDARVAGLSTASAYLYQTDKVRELTASFDGSVGASNNLMTAMQNRYQTELQLIQQVDQMMSSISGNVTSQNNNFLLDTLDPAGQYDFYDQQMQTALDMIKLSTDPAIISSYATQFLAAQNSAWNLLSPEQKKTNLGDFQADGTTLANTVTAQGGVINANLAADNAALGTAIKDAITSAIKEAFAPVTTDMQTAANTPVKVDSRVDVNVKVNVPADVETTYLGITPGG